MTPDVFLLQITYKAKIHFIGVKNRHKIGENGFQWSEASDLRRLRSDLLDPKFGSQNQLFCD